MNFIKKALVPFLASLGVIFLILIAMATYVVIADPFDVKPLLFPSETEFSSQSDETSQSETAEGADSEANAADTHPALSPSQEKALETFGIDPAAIPTEITPEQESCFIEVLGEARVNEIKAGGTPTASEFFRARGCIE